MRLVPIKINRWEIYTVCNEHGESKILTFLRKLNPQYSGSRNRLLNIIEMASEESTGPTQFHDNISHYVDKENKIWEFIAGRLRLLWFYSPVKNQVIICSHVFLKKSQNTPKSEIKRAVKLKKSYFQAATKNQIEIIQDCEGRHGQE
ncbi:MAG: type II toxin-antitoxin system RelE/ParE family toxin [Thermodesulfobacteriota bacterium]|nr:type II toxin-antitoxin system RelE/ParE family toxin [Thermodesulfobacteriota bacterium]